MEILYFLAISLTSLLLLVKSSTAYDLIFAVNCGGGKHTDRFGIKYSSDGNPTGIASSFGQSLTISRVHPDDMPLYQTERYHTSTFGYSTRVLGDGEYLVILKFAEVYFTGPGQKVFDVVLNGVPVIQDLDIFARVGKAMAHDEVVPFTVEGQQLSVRDATIDFDGTLSIQFAKGPADNPKVNAIVVLKGPFQQSEIPALPPPQLQQEDPDPLDQDQDMDEWNKPSTPNKFKKPSGPRTLNPYSLDESWFMPITVAIAVFLPILFCMCRIR
jgi:hypothetical protein